MERIITLFKLDRDILTDEDKARALLKKLPSRIASAKKSTTLKGEAKDKRVNMLLYLMFGLKVKYGIQVKANQKKFDAVREEMKAMGKKKEPEPAGAESSSEEEISSEEEEEDTTGKYYFERKYHSIQSPPELGDAEARLKIYQGIKYYENYDTKTLYQFDAPHRKIGIYSYTDGSGGVHGLIERDKAIPSDEGLTAMMEGAESAEELKAIEELAEEMRKLKMMKPSGTPTTSGIVNLEDIIISPYI